MKKKRIVVTGGHLTPALAVIDELLERGNWEIFFLGRKYTAEGEKTPSVEGEIITQKGIWFFDIAAGRIQRKFTSQTLPSALRIPLGFFRSLWYLAKIRPQVILSFGSYVSVPVVIAGWLLRIPSVAHEQTAVLGLANKINAFFVKKIALSWPQSLSDVSKEKAVLTGNMIRKELFRVDKKFWRTLKYGQNLPLIFITGGNQGSHTINQAVRSVLPQLVKKANVFHQSGHLSGLADFEELEKARDQLPENLKKCYHVKKYLLAEEMGPFLNKASLVISRAGANIVTELAALGKPGLFIPIPWSAGNEQAKNAQMLVDVGIAEILPQRKLSGTSLLKLVDQMMTNLDQYKKNAPQAKKLVKLDAAKKVADLVEETVK